MGDRKESKPQEYKTAPAYLVKADEERGVVEHIITVFGILDSGGDISHPGSFTKTISERGQKVRVLDMHRTDSVLRIVGKPLNLREVGRGELPGKVLKDHPEATGGLWAMTQFFMDTPEGKGAFIRAREDAVDWSYGYDALDFDYSEEEKGDDKVRARNLRTVRLWEYGPVLWGMVPGTTTVSAKGEDGSTEGKPAPDVTENTIRIRVRDPGDFEEGSFRTIRMGSEEQGIQAVIGRLEGETSTTVQSYVFDKEKWTVEEAQGWVDEHKKDALPELDDKQMTEDDAVPTEDDEGPYLCECLECGHEAEFEAHCRDVKCPECGGEMRRKDRPGVGKGDDKGAIGKADWPLAGRDKAWDNSAAEKRIRSWAGAEDGPNAKYRSCHFWYDAENADNFTAYKLLFCDVVNGNVQAIPRGLFAVAAVLQGARGGAAIPAADQAAIKGKVGRYYARMREEFDDDSIAPPWEKSEPMRVQSKDNLATCPTCGEIIEINIPTPDARAMLSEAMDKMKEMLDEEKTGRVLAARNATRIANALTALIEVLEDAGVDIPGYGKESADDKEAGPEEPPEKSDGGPDESPTSVETDEADRLRNQARILELDMELMQMTTEV